MRVRVEVLEGVKVFVTVGVMVGVGVRVLVLVIVAVGVLVGVAHDPVFVIFRIPSSPSAQLPCASLKSKLTVTFVLAGIFWSHIFHT